MPGIERFREPETSKPEKQNTETQKPEQQSSETQKPEQASPETQKTEQSNPETQNPEKTGSETDNPEQSSPEVNNPDQDNPETQNPEQYSPETQNPEQDNPETQNPEQKNPEETDPEGEADSSEIQKDFGDRLDGLLDHIADRMDRIDEKVQDANLRNSSEISTADSGKTSDLLNPDSKSGGQEISPEQEAGELLDKLASQNDARAEAQEKAAIEKIENGQQDYAFLPGNRFVGKCHEKPYIMTDIRRVKIDYVKRDSVDTDKLRKKYDYPIKKNFLIDLGKHHADELKAKGFSDTDIEMLKDGTEPPGCNVHHKLSLDDSGTNDFSNLILIRSDTEHPNHDAITNYQKRMTGDMKPGESKRMDWPMPVGNIYKWEG